MAINKNFVVKNGIEVNTNLIVADTDSNKVGIGTTVPEYTLHVFQGTGIGASSVNITGIGTFLEELNVGLAGTTLTVLSNDSVAGTGGSIGVGTALPAYVLDVRAPVSTGQTALYVQGDMRVTGDINIDDISIGDLNVSGISTFVGNVITSGITTLSSSGGITTTGGDLFVGGGAEVTGLTTITGILDANNTTQSSSSTTGAATFAGGMGVAKNLFVGGGAEVTGLVTASAGLECSGAQMNVTANFVANSAKVSDLTDNRVVIAGASGELEDSADLTFDGTTLAVDAVFDSNDTTQSTSATTGSAQFAGGVGIEKQLYVGAGASVGAGLTVKGDILPEADGTRDLGSSGAEFKDLYIDGTANIDSLSADTAAIGDLTDNRVVIAGSSGELEDSADLTFDGTTLAVNAIFDSNDATQSSSSTTGSAQFAGGVGVAKNLYVGGGQVTVGIHTITDLRVGTQLAGQTLVGITTILDEDSFASNSAAALATQQSIKAYVDAQITAEDLDFQGDSGGAQSVDLDSQTFTIAGTTNEIETSGSGQTLTIGLPNNVTIGGELDVTTLDVSGNADIDGHTELDNVNVAGFSTFVSNVIIGTGATVGFGSTAFFRDDAKAIFGDGEDLKIYHRGDHSFISDEGTGQLTIMSNGAGVEIQKGTTEFMGRFLTDGAVELYYDNSKKLETTPGGTITTGINTSGGFRATGNNTPAAGQGLEMFCPDTSTSQIQSFDRENSNFDKLIIKGEPVEIYNGSSKKFETNASGILVTGITTVSSTAHLTVPVGTTAQRDSIVANGMIRYNTTLNSYEGYGNGAWGGLGGGTEIDTSVSSTSATSITTFAHAEYRSAYFRVQIVQGSAYQVGRYLLIHDGTTVTVVEESAVATGDMLGTITAAIVSTNVVIYVNMGSSSSATITTIIDKITV